MMKPITKWPSPPGVPDRKSHTSLFRSTEGVSAIETPIGADHGYPVGQKICAGARHDEAHHKVAESTWGSTHVAETTIFHEPRITEVQAGGRRTDLPASGPSVVHFLGLLQ